MKTKHRNAFLLAALAALTLSGACTTDDAPHGSDADDLHGSPITFTATIPATAPAAAPSAAPPATRTTPDGDRWLPTDRVGITVSPTAGTVFTPVDNKPYRVDGLTTPAASATLAPDDGTPLRYPREGSLDIMAYYPYDTNATYGRISLDLTDQSDPAALDVMMAKVANVSQSQSPVRLSFRHISAKVTLNVTAGTGLTAGDISALTGADVSAGPIVAHVDIELKTEAWSEKGQQSINLYKSATPSEGVHATFSAIIPPYFTPNIPITFQIGGREYTCTLTSTDRFLAGNNYIYPVTVNDNGIRLGTPAITAWDVQGSAAATVPTLEVVRIPAGKFLMGSSDGSNPGDRDGSGLNTTPAEPHRFDNETQHWVELTKDFHMGKYLVTNAQYVEFLNAKGVVKETITDGNLIGPGGQCTWGENDGQPMFFADGYTIEWDDATSKWVPGAGRKKHPVVYITWYGAYEYAAWAGGTLPTEAQWEYACRAGKANHPFGVGTGYRLDNTLANFDWEFSWDWDGSSPAATTPNTGTSPRGIQAVGSYPPNAWGLYDMHGNVREWCLDSQADYPTDTTKDKPAKDPVKPGSNRVLRGGHYLSQGQACRSAYRNYSTAPRSASYEFGFRVVFPAP
ncbi:SUMF1/EgtB/PvdO family nonheme iron enzyme [Phocaeicola sp.]